MLGVQLLALDVASFENVLGKGLQDRFLPELEVERLHASDEAPLLVPHGSQRLG